MNLIEAGASRTMTSREIAELVESTHPDVKRSIERLAAKGVIAIPPSAGYLEAVTESFCVTFCCCVTP